MRRTKNIIVGLPPDLDAALREAASREERTITALVHRALRAELGLSRATSQPPPAMGAAGHENT